jgi:CarD family transcriptional regulator
MPFSEGETIIHPFHGPVRVTQIRERTVRGRTAPCLDLVAVNNTLSISVPVDRAEDTGLRAVASPEPVASLIDILRAPSAVLETQWSRRVKNYNERLTTGNIEDLCFVIREISRSGNTLPASAEGQILRNARATLAIETQPRAQDRYGAGRGHHRHLGRNRRGTRCGERLGRLGENRKNQPSVVGNRKKRRVEQLSFRFSATQFKRSSSNGAVQTEQFRRSPRCREPRGAPGRLTRRLAAPGTRARRPPA